jgi:IS30 family transposase
LKDEKHCEISTINASSGSLDYGHTHILTFIDDFSCKTWLYFLSKKSQTLATFKLFRSIVETHDKKVESLRSDRGGNIFLPLLWHTTKTPKYRDSSPLITQQNGIAERKNMTLLEAIRSIVRGTKVPKYLWEEIAKAVNYIQNRLPTKALRFKTPEQAFTGIHPNLSHLRVLG